MTWQHIEARYLLVGFTCCFVSAKHNKMKKRGEYMKRELGEGLKLFLECCSLCRFVRWERRRRKR
jgi:hypothetical protein